VAAIGMQPGREDAAPRRFAFRLRARPRRRRRRTDTQVARSSQSRMRLKVSEPITSARFVRARADHAVGDLSCVEKARADRRDVERDAIVDAERGLDDGGAGRERSGRGWRSPARSGRSIWPPAPAASSAASRGGVASVRSSRPVRRCGGCGYRCARRSIRRWCRPSPPARHWRRAVPAGPSRYR
jgi:hypothetical protein